MSRESRPLFSVAASGFAFIGVAAIGGVLTVAEIFAANIQGWETAWPGALAGSLASVAGTAGYLLSREHSRAILAREGLMLELEQEFDSLRNDAARLGETQGRIAERTRLSEDTLKEFVKEQRLASDQALALIEIQKQKIADLEARLAELEAQLAGKTAVRVEVSR